MTAKEALEMLKRCGTNVEEPYETMILEALEEIVNAYEMLFFGEQDE